ncbi:MAG: ATP-binding protein [Cyanophyceae cyanobacterium]
MLLSQISSLLQEVAASPEANPFGEASVAPSTVVSAATLRAFIRAVVELLNEQQLEATILVKCPDETWVEELASYQPPTRAAKIYDCTDQNRPQSRHLPKLTPLQTEFLEHEYFFIVLSPQLSGVILAQPQTAISQEMPQELNETSPLKMTCSFVPAVVARVVEAIAQRSTLPETVVQSLPAFTTQIDGLTALLLKQVQSADEASSPASPSIEQLTAALRLKEEFLDRLVRELRPPITNMKTALRLLESKQLKRQQRQRYLELLQRECSRQHAVITGLLELVQLDNSAQASDTVRLEDFVPGIVSTYQPLAAEKGVALGYTIPANLPPVNCPTAWLRQIIINLLDNSLKYTASQGRVYVQAYLRHQAVEIVFSDTGIGIESHELPKIFDGFYRGRTAPTELASAGLGLTVVQQLLQRCGGSVSVTSRVGKGSTFRVLLPIASPSPQTVAMGTTA